LKAAMHVYAVLNMGGPQNCKQIAYVFILVIDTSLWGGWNNRRSNFPRGWWKL
jgi:hypothetical protein